MTMTAEQLLRAAAELDGHVSEEEMVIIRAVASAGDPDSALYDFEVRQQLTRPEGEQIDPEVLAGLVSFLPKLRIDIDPEERSRLRFSLFCAYLVLLSRVHNMAPFREAIADHRTSFGKEPYFKAFEAQAYCLSKSIEDLELGLDAAEEALEAYPRRPAVLHTAAELIAELSESSTDPELLERGMALIRKAITESERLDRPYPKYYSTYARLLNHSDQYEEAQDMILKAIDLEEVTTNIGVLRSAQYHVILAQIRSQKVVDDQRLGLEAQSKVLDEQQKQLLKDRELIEQSVEKTQSELESKLSSARDELSSQMDRQRGQLLELLGLLAAVIAFLVTGAQTSNNYDAGDAIAVLSATAAATAGIFAAFRLLFVSDESDERRSRQALLVVALSIGLVAILIGYTKT